MAPLHADSAISFLRHLVLFGLPRTPRDEIDRYTQLIYVLTCEPHLINHVPHLKELLAAADGLSYLLNERVAIQKMLKNETVEGEGSIAKVVTVARNMADLWMGPRRCIHSLPHVVLSEDLTIQGVKRNPHYMAIESIVEDEVGSQRLANEPFLGALWNCWLHELGGGGCLVVTVPGATAGQLHATMLQYHQPWWAKTWIALDGQLFINRHSFERHMQLQHAYDSPLHALACLGIDARIQGLLHYFDNTCTTFAEDSIIYARIPTIVNRWGAWTIHTHAMFESWLMVMVCVHRPHTTTIPPKLIQTCQKATGTKFDALWPKIAGGIMLPSEFIPLKIEKEPSTPNKKQMITIEVSVIEAYYLLVNDLPVWAGDLLSHIHLETPLRPRRTEHTTWQRHWRGRVEMLPIADLEWHTLFRSVAGSDGWIANAVNYSFPMALKICVSAHTFPQNQVWQNGMILPKNKNAHEKAIQKVLNKIQTPSFPPPFPLYSQLDSLYYCMNCQAADFKKELRRRSLSEC